ncbi:hypothetical protein Gogos_002993 [Gossypium gossypioides]|uniref:CCHC-type domain-containing protein n=1 Tax=Gossypium gossypioides TaxID=34282 RepID=A0A7J9CKM0_GOSGO|nr:hypothetical protein [Gossypium gossypioides]
MEEELANLNLIDKEDNAFHEEATVVDQNYQFSLIGKDRTVYAYFQYEKLSLFCFICGKLGHGKSFCPFWTSIESSKIVFGWDISLRVVVQRRNATVSKWLCEVDGS